MSSIQRYFIDSDAFLNQLVCLSKDDSFHIVKVMRQSIGSFVQCVCPNQTFLGRIESLQPLVSVRLESVIEEDFELDREIILIYGMPKNEKFEFVLQKATELGVSKIIPWLSKRSIVKLDEAKFQKKLERWKKIAKEAAEQSHRQVVPTIEPLIDLPQIEKLEATIKLVAYENSEDMYVLSKSLDKVSKHDKIVIVVGPEGGIDDIEIERLKGAGYLPCSLGKRILRTETAVVFALSAIVYQFELKGS